MAKQIGPVRITGTVHGLTFYQLEDDYYVRRKSSLTRKRVLTDPAFAKTRQENQLMAQASATASKVYRQLNNTKTVQQYRQLTAEAKRLYRDGLTERTVTKRLFEYAKQKWGLKKVP